MEEAEKENGSLGVQQEGELVKRAHNYEIMMMSVKEWLVQQAIKMGIEWKEVSETDLFERICAELKKKRE